MNSKRYVAASASLAVIAVIGLSVGYKTRGEVNLKPLPRHGWTVGFHAFRMSGFKDLPVKVYGVRSAGEQGLEAVHVNSSNSGQIVTGMRLKWFVCERGKTAILAKGETPLLNLPGLVGARPRFEVAVPGATLDRIMRPVMKDGQLRGDFDVEVVVSEVKYLDGSSWELSDPKTLVIAPVKQHHAAMDMCDGQTCRLAPELFTYQCADSRGENCTNQGNKCESFICNLAD